jgi:ribosomal protein S2
LRSIRLFASRIAESVMSGRGMKESIDAEAAREAADAAAADEQARRLARPPVRRARPEAAPASA